MAVTVTDFHVRVPARLAALYEAYEQAVREDRPSVNKRSQIVLDLIEEGIKRRIAEMPKARQDQIRKAAVKPAA